MLKKVTTDLTQIAGVSVVATHDFVDIKCACGDVLRFSHDRNGMDYYNCLNPDCAIELITVWAEDPEE